MAQNSRRNKRRRPVNGTQPHAANGQPGAANGNGHTPNAQNGQTASNGAPDRYQKYLPEWMKGPNGATPPRPRGPRRPRQRRPAGGYTPGKSIGGGNAMGDF